MRTFSQKVKREFRELIPVTVFFFFAFEVLALTQALMLRQYGIRVSVFLEAAIGAFLVAKVVLITDHFPLVNRFPHRPLLYNVLWKTTVYFTASLAVRYVEHFVRFRLKTHSFAEANSRLFAEIIWPHFWAVQLWLLLLLLLYCAFRELARAVGHERIIRMYLHDAPTPSHEGQAGHDASPAHR